MTSWAASSAIILGTLIWVSAPLSAEARTHKPTAHAASAHAQSSTHRSRRAVRTAHYRGRGVRYAGISCVPFARAESGIALSGNAATWWDAAEGRYARGSAPEAGSVLNFRANASMHLGHVAVVRDVVNARQIEIDQANWWGPGGGHGVISRDITVVDVSAHNDWTAVRVALGHSGAFGSVYPTYGFIYQRPDGTAPPAAIQVAAATDAPILNPAPRDLRRHGRRQAAAIEEVAEAPADKAGPLSLDAPDRNLK